jgi:hypothetical protein
VPFPRPVWTRTGRAGRQHIDETAKVKLLTIKSCLADRCAQPRGDGQIHLKTAHLGASVDDGRIFPDLQRTASSPPNPLHQFIVGPNLDRLNRRRCTRIQQHLPCFILTEVRRRRLRPIRMCRAIGSTPIPPSGSHMSQSPLQYDMSALQAGRDHRVGRDLADQRQTVTAGPFSSAASHQ